MFAYVAKQSRSCYCSGDAWIANAGADSTTMEIDSAAKP